MSDVVYDIDERDGPMEHEDDNKSFQSFFAEHEQVKQLIATFNITNIDVYQIEKTIAEFTKILEKYQEQAQLLDPHLEDMINQVMTIVRSVIFITEEQKNTRYKTEIYGTLRHALFKTIYMITKVRGYKTILKHFPHEIYELEPLFQIYSSIPKDEEWETRYIILLWLSLIVMNPFDLSIVDSSQRQSVASSSSTLADKMITEARNCLNDAGKVRDGAAVFLARILTRPDMTKHQLPEFLKWCTQELETSSDPFLKAGISMTLVNILNFGSRADLLNVLPIISHSILTDKPTNTLLKQLSIKLIQRVGLVYLKPRVVGWRYKKSRHALMSTDIREEDEEQDDDIDIPDMIEEVIEKLLNALREKDTIVRWSAAKGIGRVTGRLPMEMGDQVVDSLLELFSQGEGDSAWHGGCLALAELSRRGLLLPARLPTIIPVINKALVYDERRGAHSVGSHVRDAACYVCWAFARAYAPQVMSPYVSILANGLLCMAVFDRELNCRRAAAAAFQENVGRQGNFPHGIDILTRADYFTLCNRTNAYLEISHFIAQYEEYRHSLIDYLIDTKIAHWDKAIRDLSSKALYKLCDRDMTYISDKIVPILIPNTVSSDLNMRHGSVLALAELILALSENGYKFDDILQKKLCDVIPTIDAKKLYRGRGGEIMREAVCRLIECMAKSRIHLSGKIFQDTIDENLKHPNEEIVEKAVSAFSAYCSAYYLQKDDQFKKDLVQKYTKILSDEENTKRGYSLALGSLPHGMIVDQEHFNHTIEVLRKKTELEVNQVQQDAEARRNAVNAIIQLCHSHKQYLNESITKVILQCFMNGCEDYAVDKRGDVGSFVREASMLALADLSQLGVVNNEQMNLIIGIILKQACEKIDRVRATAGSILARLVSDPTLVFIHKEFINELINNALQERKEQIQDLSNRDPNAELLDWSSAEETFKIFVSCLSLDEYRLMVLSGLVISVGGLSSHVFKHSADALVKFIKEKDQMENIANGLVKLLWQYSNEERVNLPLLKSIGHLFSHDCFQSINHSFMKEIIKFIKEHQTKNVQKMFYMVDILCELLKFEEPTRSEAMTLVMSNLMSIYPKVREYTSTQLYSALQVFGDEILGDFDLVDKFLDLLSTTNYSSRTSELKPIVTELCSLANVELVIIGPTKKEERQ
jgi:hypothetical protein